MSPSLPTVLLAWLALASLCGCQAPPKDPPRDVAEVSAPSSTASSAVPVVSASAASVPSATKPRGCTSDADCHTFSSYCSEAPCACRAVGNGEPDPKCLSGGKVQCFADPCMKKLASCQGGACVLTAQPVR